MKRTRATARRIRPASLAIMVALLLAGCTGGVAPTPPGPPAEPAPPDRTVVPTAWVEATEAAWPGSVGKQAGVLYSVPARQCAFGEQRMRVLDTEFRPTEAGYGPHGRGPDGFIHRCALWTSRRLGPGELVDAAGELVLTHYPDAAALQRDVADLRSRFDTPQQTNEVARLTSGRYTVDTLRRWYPTNPQGEYQALVVDEPQRTTLSFAINSLSRADFEATSAQQVADAFTDFLERSHAAPTAGPRQVPSWATAVWQDAGAVFHLAVARDWAQDPRFGAMEDPIAVAHFVDPDRTAAVSVLPTRPDTPPRLSATVEKARTTLPREGYTVERDEVTTLDDGRPAHLFVATQRDRRLATFLTTTDTHLFVITCSAPSDRWDSTQPDMLRMARSFVAEP